MACHRTVFTPERDPHEPGRQVRAQPQCHQCTAQAAEHRLALAADVEQPAVEGHRHRQAGEDEGGRVIQGVADAGPAAEGALDQLGDHLHRVEPNHRHHDGTDQQGHHQVDQRQHGDVEPARQVHGAAHIGPPVVGRREIARPSCRVLLRVPRRRQKAADVSSFTCAEHGSPSRRSITSVASVGSSNSTTTVASVRSKYLQCTPVLMVRGRRVTGCRR